MVIGIDSSRAFLSDKTGTENYSYHVIKEMLRLPESRLHTFVLFIRPNSILPQEIVGYSNVIVKVIKLPYLWTQLGLAWETWRGTPLEVLWVPAHTLPLLRNSKVKTVVTIHGLEYQWLPEYKNLLQKWYLPLSTIYAANAATKLIAVSKFTQNQLVEELHTIPKKIKVIHEGVEFGGGEVSQEQMKATLKKQGLLKDGYILFVGTVQPRKNLEALIKAFADYARSFPDQKLVIAGSLGWMAEEILNAPTRYGVSEKVVFTGRVTDSELNALYRQALMYVQPSITEGFGLPVLEAMNSGLAVISSNGGALSEIVGTAGMIVKLGENFVTALTETMVKVGSDQKLRRKLSAAGKKRVKDFTWVKAAKETLQLLLKS
jgi:glycosyltransferase involved in cell wall biosynthesis